MKGLAVLLTSLTSGATQIVTYLIGWFAGGTANLPQPAISLGSTWTSVIISLLDRLLGPTLSTYAHVNDVTQIWWLPTAINLVGGWVLLGLALIGAITVFKGVFTGILVVALIIALVFLVFGLHFPVHLLPTNSTMPTNSTIPG